MVPQIYLYTKSLEEKLKQLLVKISRVEIFYLSNVTLRNLSLYGNYILSLQFTGHVSVSLSSVISNNLHLGCIVLSEIIFSKTRIKEFEGRIPASSCNLFIREAPIHKLLFGA